jgi:hypothetical protein
MMDDQEMRLMIGAHEASFSRSVRGGYAADALIAALLALGAAYFAWVLTGMHGHIPILLDAKADDVWFEADVSRVYDNMSARFSNHFRSQVHPLFSLYGLGLTHLFTWLPGLDKMGAVRLAIAATAALWMVLFFVLLRTLRCRRLDATVFSLVAATSASFFFWIAVPETYLIGSATIVVVLAITALGERRDIPPWLDVAMAAAALSILVTNFMFGLISLTVRHRLKVAAQLAANALVVVVLLWTVQKFIAPSAHFFLGDHEGVAHVEAMTVPKIFFLDTLVMPDIESIANDHPWLWLKLSTQTSLTWKLTTSGTIALVAWIILLTAGAWAAVSMRSLGKFRLILGLGIAGQLLLHMLYGNESFLYALNWLPLLVTVAALSTLTRLRWMSLAAAIVFIVSAAHHNYSELEFAFSALAGRAM